MVNQYGNGKKKKKSTPHIKHVKNTGLEVKRNPPTSRVPFNLVDVIMKRQYGTQQGRMGYTDAVLRQKVFPKKVLQNAHSKTLSRQKSLQPPSKTSRMSVNKRNVI